MNDDLYICLWIVGPIFFLIIIPFVGFFIDQLIEKKEDEDLKLSKNQLDELNKDRFLWACGYRRVRKNQCKCCCKCGGRI